VKPLRVVEPASAELAEAVRWYERQRPGLGAELFDAVAHTVDLIRTNPEIGSLRQGRFPSRQFPLRRFPYKIVYRERDDDIYIVAIAHTARRPNYWKDRP
jgi:toxin ParE1/3/4